MARVEHAQWEDMCRAEVLGLILRTFCKQIAVATIKKRKCLTHLSDEKIVSLLIAQSCTTSKKKEGVCVSPLGILGSNPMDFVLTNMGVPKG